jgi:TPR repeat protein
MHRWIAMVALLLTMGATLPAWSDDAEDCGNAETLLKTNPDTAVSACRRRADQGNAAAQSSLGNMYQSGKGVPQNYAEAMKWYSKAADQGLAEAEVGLGIMYDNGQGVPPNSIQAAKWYRKAADQGNGLAQLFLGQMYEKGRGVPQDYLQAYMWLNLCAAGFPDSRAVGYTVATSARDEVAGKMSQDQIAQAQALAAAWKPTTGQ